MLQLWKEDVNVMMGFIMMIKIASSVVLDAKSVVKKCVSSAFMDQYLKEFAYNALKIVIVAIQLLVLLAKIIFTSKIIGAIKNVIISAPIVHMVYVFLVELIQI
jgi:uncharacterized membrane protein